MMTRVTLCPQCGVKSESDPRFVEWCESCGWHADPDPPALPKSRRKRREAERDDRRVRQAFNECSAAADLRSVRDPSRFIATAYAVIVHLITLALLVAAGFVAFSSLVIPIKVVVALLLVGAAIHVRPRFAAMRVGIPVTEPKAPILWARVKEVSRKVGARPPDVILISSAFNASYGSHGLRRRRYLVIGYPLWNVLSEPERVALLAHELAHDVNHDLRRNVIVGSALAALAHWFGLLAPTTRPPVKRQSLWGARVSFLELLIAIIFAPLALIVSFAGRHLLRVADKSGQRGEYLADEMSAVVAGSAATKGALTKILLEGSFERALQTAAQQGVGDLWLAESEFLESVPESEIQRRRRVGYSRLSRIDVTHPPTEFRIRMIETHPYRHPSGGVIMGAMGAIDEELRPWADRIQSSIRDDHPAVVRTYRAVS